MLTKGVWNHINMLSILMIMMMFAWTPSSAEPGPAPQNYWLSSIFDGSFAELPPTGENLLMAAEEGNLDVIKDLLARGAAINYGHGESLEQAARNGHLEVVKFLLESGANPNGTNDKRYVTYSGRPLQAAAENNHLDIIDLLLEFGATAKLPRVGLRVMDRAAENGHLEAIQRLLQAGADPDDGDGYSVFLAAREGHLDIVKAFIEAGADVNNGESWIVAKAAGEGHLEVVRALVEAGATNKTISYSMASAASKGQLEVIKLLLEKGADPSYGGVLKSGAEFGDVELVRTLLEAGSNITYDVDDSPLHFAAVEGHPDVIAVLVEYGADINRALQKDWWDPLPPYDTKYGNGWTVMHVAARFGHPMVQELLELGADIHIQDVKGRTPLHVAVFYEKLFVAKELLRFCADLTDVDNEGQMPLDVAKDLSLKNASDISKYYRILMLLLKEIIPEKIALTPSNEKAKEALRDEFLALLETNSTLKERFKDVQTDYLDVDLYSSLSYIFKERARSSMANIIEDHNCKAPMEKEEEQGITVAIGTEYLTRCDCVAGQGPKMTVTPREETNLCTPVSPPQEEE